MASGLFEAAGDLSDQRFLVLIGLGSGGQVVLLGLEEILHDGVHQVVQLALQLGHITEKPNNDNDSSYL